MADTLLLDTDARGVATITLNRPQIHNAFDDALIVDLIASLKRVELDPKVRVVVLAASGRSFCAGADLNWMKRMATYSERENRRDAEQLATLMRTLDRLAKPTVAKVQGAAYAGGTGLVACCDVALAAETAKFAVTEVRIGLIPAVISPYLVQAIGPRWARRYFLTAETFDAREAERIGLIHGAFKPDQLDFAVNQVCDLLLANGPKALAECKDMLRLVSRGPIDDAMTAETAGRIARIRVTQEGREGIASFLEKRKPAWRS
ncbi:MAG TPA: enoyl-CoA hydratase/isomerase family protein [Alphaproteobacteria bacterium]|nr:enoyl-CoA hydratase/isomerase family protein [Alphaproteobacteria bacterium]